MCHDPLLVEDSDGVSGRICYECNTIADSPVPDYMGVFFDLPCCSRLDEAHLLLAWHKHPAMVAPPNQVIPHQLQTKSTNNGLLIPRVRHAST
jgi:hypothetical protein